jgi:hypothetical protein
MRRDPLKPGLVASRVKIARDVEAKASTAHAQADVQRVVVGAAANDGG